MILSQPQIREAVNRGEIRFDPPLEERQWHEASVDLRLGLKFTKLTAKRGLKVSLAHGISAIADAGLWKEKILRREDELGKKKPSRSKKTSSCWPSLTNAFGFLAI